MSHEGNNCFVQSIDYDSSFGGPIDTTVVLKMTGDPTDAIRDGVFRAGTGMPTPLPAGDPWLVATATPEPSVVRTADAVVADWLRCVGFIGLVYIVSLLTRLIGEFL